MTIPFWEFCLRVVLLYVIVALALRIMGKREIGQLSVFDFVVSVMIAELSAVPMEDPKQPITEPIVAIGSLVLLQLLVAILQMKSHRFRHFVDGEPTVLIEHGRIQDREMKRMRYTINDLLMQLREKGVANVADVEFAILETSGELSVVQKAEKRPLTNADIHHQVSPEMIHLPLVSDGQVVKQSLQRLHRDEPWVREQLRRRGYRLEDVFYASMDESGGLFIDEIDKKDGKGLP